MAKVENKRPPLPYVVRIASILLVVINFRGALFGASFFWLLLPIPGLIAYVGQIGIALGSRSRSLVQAVSILGLLYNLCYAQICIQLSSLSFEQWWYSDLGFANGLGSMYTSFSFTILLYSLQLISIFKPASRFNPPVYHGAPLRGTQ